jgi:uncharacterized protein YukE
MNEVKERPSANPFGDSQVAVRPTTAVANTDQHRAVAEVQAAMMIARMNPRDPIAAMDRILNACSRPTLADAAVYQYSKGGSDVSGPSIRLAEAMAQQWGNIKTSVRELDQSNGISTVQTIAWDLETGYQCDKVFHVPHIRFTKNGSKRLEDPRDIYELVANQGARRLRACILAVIPGDVTEAAVGQCEVTMKARADVSPEAMQKMATAFAAYGVSREQIEKRIQRRLDAIQPAQVVSLKKIYASLRDGMSTAAEWFDAVEPGQPAGAEAVSAADKAKAAIKAKSRKADRIDMETGEVNAPAPETEQRTYAQCADSILEAADAAAGQTALNAALKFIPPEFADELQAVYANRWQ